MTALGLIIAFVGLIAFIWSEEWLFSLLILSVPFSGTSVLNVGSGQGASGVQAWMYFGLLWLIRQFGDLVVRPNRGLPVPLLRRSGYFLGFIVALTASLIMPLWINGHLEIQSPHLNDLTSNPLHFQSANVTSLLYVVFGSLIAIFIAKRSLDADRAESFTRLYLSAGILAAVLGILEFSAKLAHLPSPTLLFRNSASPGAAAYRGMLGGGLFRVSSVAVEPSILSQFLLTVLPLTLPALLGRGGYVFSRSRDRLALILILITMLLTTSSLSYIGLLMVPIVALPITSRLGLKTGRFAWYAGGVLAGATGITTVLYFTVPLVRIVLNLALLAKSGSFSALERIQSIELAWSYFKSYPVLGVGWGSVTSHDLVILLLSNAGIVGFLSFAAIVMGIGRPLYRSLEPLEDWNGSIRRGTWILSGLLLLLASALSEFPYVFGHLWMVAGFALAASLQLPARAGTSLSPAKTQALGANGNTDIRSSLPQQESPGAI